MSLTLEQAWSPVLGAGALGGPILVAAGGLVVVLAILLVFLMVLRSNGDARKMSSGFGYDGQQGAPGQPRAPASQPQAQSWSADGGYGAGPSSPLSGGQNGWGGQQARGGWGDQGGGPASGGWNSPAQQGGWGNAPAGAPGGSGWGDQNAAGGWNSPAQQPGGAPAWGAPAAQSQQGGWGNAPAAGGWGDQNAAGGWNSPAQQQGGWGNAPAAGGWGSPAATAQGGPDWGAAPNAPMGQPGYGAGYGAGPAQRMGVLIVRQGKEPGRTFEMRKDRTTIGRSRESDIFLEDLAVSRLHTTIGRDASGRYILHDENSANGTFVNGQRVSEHVLEEGDEVQVGQTVLAFVRR